MSEVEIYHRSGALKIPDVHWHTRPSLTLGYELNYFGSNNDNWHWDSLFQHNEPCRIIVDGVTYSNLLITSKSVTSANHFQIRFVSILQDIDPARVSSRTKPDVPENTVDMIAKRHGLSRRVGESDGDLRARIKYVTGRS